MLTGRADRPIIIPVGSLEDAAHAPSGVRLHVGDGRLIQRDASADTILSVIERGGGSGHCTDLRTGGETGRSARMKRL